MKNDKSQNSRRNLFELTEEINKNVCFKVKIFVRQWVNLEGEGISGVCGVYTRNKCECTPVNETREKRERGRERDIDAVWGTVSDRQI